MQILEIATMYLRTSGGESFRACTGTGEAKHPMPDLKKLLNHRRADKTRGACYKHTHYDFSLLKPCRSRIHSRACIQ
jgi:hypothetical protein